MMVDEFPSLTSRLGVIKLSSDYLRNIEFYICLNELESFVFGVISQYSRIMDDEPKPLSNTPLSHSLDQLKLDIYYYTLTWDKLKKVFGVLKDKINDVLKSPNALPSEFRRDFKQIRIRIEHLFGELSTSARNEYEHPSLNPSRIGELVGFGNSTSDNQGNIKAHIGNEEYAIVRKEHVDRLFSLWVELIDIFVKHFTSKTPSAEILLVKRQIEENIDDIIDTYTRYRTEKRDKEADQIFHQILMSKIYLSNRRIKASSYNQIAGVGE
jgi:hypothetical protein